MLATRQPASRPPTSAIPLVGQARGQRAGDRVHADRQRRHAHGGADFRRDRLRARPAAARRGQAAQHAGREGGRRAGEPHHLHRHGPVPRRAALRQRQGQEPAEGHPRAPGALPRGGHRDAEVQAHEQPELPDRRPDAVAAGLVQRSVDRGPLAVRPRRGEQADGRGRLRERLRGGRSTARTTATSTTRRSASRWPACGRRSA